MQQMICSYKIQNFDIPMSNQNSPNESMSAHSLSFRNKIESIWSDCNDFMTNRGYEVPRFSFRGFHLSPSIYYLFHPI